MPEKNFSVIFPKFPAKGSYNPANPPKRVLVGISLNTGTGVGSENIQALLQSLRQIGVERVFLANTAFLHRHNITAEHIAITDLEKIISTALRAGDAWAKNIKPILDEFNADRRESSEPFVSIVNWYDLTSEGTDESAMYRKFEEQVRSKIQNTSAPFNEQLANTALGYVIRSAGFKEKAFLQAVSNICGYSTIGLQQFYEEHKGSVNNDQRIKALIEQLNAKYNVQLTLKEFQEKCDSLGLKPKPGLQVNLLLQLFYNQLPTQKRIQNNLVQKFFATSANLEPEEITQLVERTYNQGEGAISLRPHLQHIDTFIMLTESLKEAHLKSFLAFLNHSAFDLETQHQFFAFARTQKELLPKLILLIERISSQTDRALFDIIFEILKGKLVPLAAEKASLLEDNLKTLLSTIYENSNSLKFPLKLFLFLSLESKSSESLAKTFCDILTKPSFNKPYSLSVPEASYFIKQDGSKKTITDFTGLELALIETLCNGDQARLWYISILRKELPPAIFLELLLNLLMPVAKSSANPNPFIPLTGCVYTLIKESCNYFRGGDAADLSQKLPQYSQEEIKRKCSEDPVFAHFINAAEKYLKEETAGLPALCAVNNCQHFLYPGDLYEVVRSMLEGGLSLDDHPLLVSALTCSFKQTISTTSSCLRFFTPETGTTAKAEPIHRELHNSKASSSSSSTAGSVKTTPELSLSSTSSSSANEIGPNRDLETSGKNKLERMMLASKLLDKLPPEHPLYRSVLDSCALMFIEQDRTDSANNTTATESGRTRRSTSNPPLPELPANLELREKHGPAAEVSHPDNVCYMQSEETQTGSENSLSSSAEQQVVVKIVEEEKSEKVDASVMTATAPLFNEERKPSPRPLPRGSAPY